MEVHQLLDMLGQRSGHHVPDPVLNREGSWNVEDVLDLQERVQEVQTWLQDVAQGPQAGHFQHYVSDMGHRKGRHLNYPTFGKVHLNIDLFPED